MKFAIILSILLISPSSFAECVVSREDLIQLRKESINNTRAFFYFGYWRGVQDAMSGIIDEELVGDFEPKQPELRDSSLRAKNSFETYRSLHLKLLTDCNEGKLK